MHIANAEQIARFTGKQAYASGAFHNDEAAKINASVIEMTGGKLPCYAVNKGARGAFKWVSVRSSAVISRVEAAKWLARYGVTIDAAEAA